MAVTFKMKFIFVWIFLFSEVFLFPTQSPTDANLKLLYQGHDSNSGVNVYVFEFIPESKEAKDKRAQGDKSSFKGTENRENYEDINSPTINPASLDGKIKDPDTESGTRHSTHMPQLKIDTNNSTISATQNDIGMYEDTGFLSNATEGLQTGMPYTRDVQKTSNEADYYSTEGSALIDIPGYNDTDNQGPQVDFPANVNDLSNNLGCSKSEGQCKNVSKSTEHMFVTQPTTHKDLSYPKSTKDKPHTAKMEHGTKKKPNHKSKKQANRNVNTKGTPIRYNTGKIFQYSNAQRRKTGGKRRNSYKYRRSSSESRSDSSQEFD